MSDSTGRENGDQAALVRKRLSEIWKRHGETNRARLEAVRVVARSDMREVPSDEQATARREAHKLAGVLGTFGWSAGSDLAREAETLLEGELSAEGLSRLREITELLEAIVTAPDLPDEPSTATGTGVLVVDPTGELELAIRSALPEQPTLRVRGLPEALMSVRERRPRAIAISLSSRVGTLDPLIAAAEIAAAAPEVPLIGFARSAPFSARIAAARAGIRNFVTLPADPGELRSLLDNTAVRSVRRPRILAVDDDPVFLDALEAHLAGEYELERLTDPLQVWDTLTRTNPDLLLLDFDMPHVNGSEICSAVRADPALGALPILFLTSRRDAETINRIFSAGADDYLAKPVIAEELRARVAGRIQRAHLIHQALEVDRLTGFLSRRGAMKVIRRWMPETGTPLPCRFAFIELVSHAQMIQDAGDLAAEAAVLSIAAAIQDRWPNADLQCRWSESSFLIGWRPPQDEVNFREATAAFERAASTPSPGLTLDVTLRTVGIDAPEQARTPSELTRVMRAGGGASQPARAESRAAGAGPDVLLVEDDDVVAELVMHALSSHGLRLERIADGEEALRRLTDPSSESLPSVVMLDVDLPGFDGFTVLRRLRDAGALERTRVLMLTVRASEQEVVRALSTGAADHMAKPFSLPVLVHRVRQLLERR